MVLNMMQVVRLEKTLCEKEKQAEEWFNEAVMAQKKLSAEFDRASAELTVVRIMCSVQFDVLTYSLLVVGLKRIIVPSQVRNDLSMQLQNVQRRHVEATAECSELKENLQQVQSSNSELLCPASCI